MLLIAIETPTTMQPNAHSTPGSAQWNTSARSAVFDVTR